MSNVNDSHHAARVRMRRTWWMLLGQGILALLVGTLLLTNTDASLRAFAPFLALYWLTGGILDILEGRVQRGDVLSWRWSIAGGVLAITVGLVWFSGIVLGADTPPAWLMPVMAVVAMASGAANIIWAWILTIPAAAVIAWLSFLMVHLLVPGA